MQLQPLHGLPSEDQAGASSRHASCSTGGCCRSDDMIDVIIFLDDIIDAHCDCQQAEAEKAKAAAPPPGVNLSTNNQTFLKAQILFANFAISFPPAPAPEAPAVIVNVVAPPPQVGDRQT